MEKANLNDINNNKNLDSNVLENDNNFEEELKKIRQINFLKMLGATDIDEQLDIKSTKNLLKYKKQLKLENLAKKWQEKGKKNNDLLTGKLLQKAKNFQQENDDSYPFSTLAKIFIEESIKNQKINYLKFTIFCLLILLLGGVIIRHFLIKESKLKTNFDALRKCENKKDCLPRNKALENLVNANQNLQSLNLVNANLYAVNLENARLNFANFYGANLFRTNLKNANLKSGNFAYANLKNTNLENANLENTNLNNTNLNNTNLENANLENVNLENANFAGANLHNANLENTNLTKAKNLSNKQIKSACNWEKAIYLMSYDDQLQKQVINEKENQKIIEKLRQDKNSDSQKLVNCN